MPDRSFPLPWKFIAIAIVFFTATYALELYNHRFWLNDYRVYYSAAQALGHQEPVYNEVFGLQSGTYKYSPFILLLFLPFSWLPFEAAATIHFFVMAVSTILSMLIAFRLVADYLDPSAGKWPNRVLLISFLVLSFHLVRELHLGNVNMIIILLLLTALAGSLKGKQVLGGILFGIAVLFKPYMLLLALPLLFHRKLRMLGVTVLTLAASVLLMVPVSGVAGTLHLHREWFHAMAEHSQVQQSYQTLESLMGHLFTSTPAILTYLFPLLAVVAYSLFYYYGKRAFDTQPEQEIRLLVMGFFLLLAVIPNLVITDTEHFLFSMPVIIYITGNLNFKKRPVCGILAVIFFLCYAGTSTDLMGSSLADWLHRSGFIGLGNLGLIALGIWSFLMPRAIN